jgi:hypothetical protein
MDFLNDILNRRWVLPAVALVVGMALGLLYGWFINPVEWVDGTPEQMRSELRLDYMRMAVDSYSVNRDAELAVARYGNLGAYGAEALTSVGADPELVDATAIQRFRAAIEILEPESLTEAGEAAEPESEASLTRLLVPACGTTLVLGVFLALALVVRRRLRGAPVRARREREQDVWEVDDESGPEMVPVAFSAPEAAAPSREPLATFRTIYTLGDDLYDDSFSIETPAGDFVGECGVGIGDTIGVGEPKKVSAFEVWLFDKNDIQTVTKVLMSRYTYSDDASRARLSAKGDPIQAESGGVVYLETASLEVEARIVDMTYGSGALPPGSFFERMTIELRAWPRGGGGS